jgi:hypothetical protein
VPAIDSLLQQADPALNYLKPYYADIGSLLQNFGGTIQRENVSGTYIGRCLCPLSVESYTGLTPTEQALVQALIKAGGLGGIANPATNPLRGPGTQPSADTPYSGTYPHILAMAPANLRR